MTKQSVLEILSLISGFIRVVKTIERFPLALERLSISWQTSLAFSKVSIKAFELIGKKYQIELVLTG